MGKKQVPGKAKKIKILGRVYRTITPAELAEVAEELGADLVTEREDIIKLSRKINRQFRHPK